VMSDHGTQALALVRRGRYLRVAQLDLIDRRARHWCDAECDGGARTFDGDVWLTSRDGEVLAIDATAARWTATWGVDTEAVGCTLHRDGPRFAVAASTVGAVEAWFYEGFTLRRRRDVREPDAEQVWSHVAALRPATQDWVAVVSARGDQAELVRARMRPEACRLVCGTASVALPDAPAIALEVDSRFAAVALRRAGGVEVLVIHVAGQRVVATLALDGASAVTLRLAELVLTVGDDRGRAIVVDLRTGSVTSDHRLAP